jgi:hypothetical protein
MLRISLTLPCCSYQVSERALVCVQLSARGCASQELPLRLRNEYQRVGGPRIGREPGSDEGGGSLLMGPRSGSSLMNHPPLLLPPLQSSGVVGVLSLDQDAAHEWFSKRAPDKGVASRVCYYLRPNTLVRNR